MTDASSVPPPDRLVPPGAPGQTRTSLRSLTIVCYALYLLGIPTSGFTTLIGVIVAYVKRTEAAGTPWANHLDNLISVFWVSLLVSIVGILTIWFLIGFVILGVLMIWYLYRTIRGLIRALDGLPY
jgi:uncharacterized membrane protein